MGLSGYTTEEKGSIYEYFVGLEFQRMGYNVLYTGIFYTDHNDRHIDLIAYSSNEKKIFLIQCKYRSSPQDCNSLWIRDFKKAFASFQAEFKPIWTVQPIIVVNWDSIVTLLSPEAEMFGIRLKYVYGKSLDELSPQTIEQFRFRHRGEYSVSYSEMVGKYIPCKSDNQVFNDESNVFKNQVQPLLASLQKEQADNKHLQTELQKCRDELAEKIELCDKFRIVCDSQKEENEALRRGLNDQSKLYHSKCEEVRKIKQKCDELQLDCNRLKAQIDKYIKENIVLDRTGKNDAKNYLELYNIFVRLSEDYRECDGLLRLKEAEIKRLQEEVGNLQLQMQQVLNANAQLTSEILVLKKKKGKWWQR